MKLYKSLDEILADIKKDDLNKYDFNVRGKDLVFRENGTLVKKGKEYKTGLHVSDYAMTQLLTRYDLPVRENKTLFYEDPKNFTRMLNNYLQSDDRELLLRTRIDRGVGIVRAALSDNYSIVNNSDIVEQVKQLLDEYVDVGISNYFNSDKLMHMRLVFNPTKERVENKDLKEDDIIMNGIDIVNSEVGRSSLRVEPIIYRLVCTNGLKSWTLDGDDYVYMRHIHINKDELRDLIFKGVDQSLNRAYELSAKFKESKKLLLANPVEEIQKIAEDNMLSKKLTEKIIDSYYEEPSQSLYGVVNAFTRAARNLPDERRLNLEKLAGRILLEKVA